MPANLYSMQAQLLLTNFIDYINVPRKEQDLKKGKRLRKELESRYPDSSKTYKKFDKLVECIVQLRDAAAHRLFPAIIPLHYPTIVSKSVPPGHSRPPFMLNDMWFPFVEYSDKDDYDETFYKTWEYIEKLGTSPRDTTDLDSRFE